MSDGPPPPPPPPPPAPGRPHGSDDGSAWFRPLGDDASLVVAHPVGWGIGHAVLGLLAAYTSALLGTALVVAALGGTGDAPLSDELSVGLLVALQAFLWIGYVGATVVASRNRGQGVVRDFGVRAAPTDWWQGLLLGVGLQILAVPAIYVVVFLFTGERDVSAAARELTDLATSPLDAALLVLVIAIGAPLVEELFFRGLLLRSIQRRFGSRIALVGSSVVFAAIHLQLLQFPALLMFGLVAGWLTLRTGRLGPAIWAHVGFNAVTVIALLATA